MAALYSDSIACLSSWGSEQQQQQWVCALKVVLGGWVGGPTNNLVYPNSGWSWVRLRLWLGCDNYLVKWAETIKMKSFDIFQRTVWTTLRRWGKKLHSMHFIAVHEYQFLLVLNKILERSFIFMSLTCFHYTIDDSFIKEKCTSSYLDDRNFSYSRKRFKTI